MRMPVRFADPAVAAVFKAYPPAVRRKLLELRELVFETISKTEGLGVVEEALRWGQPSYLTSKPKTGSTIRLGPVGTDEVALFFHCQTTLVEEFRASYGSKLRYDGNRAILWSLKDRLPKRIVRDCVQSALLYHVRDD